MIEAVAVGVGLALAGRWLYRRGARAAERQARILAVFDRYPGQRLYGGDVARMAYTSFPELWKLEDEGLLASDWGADQTPHGRRRVYWRTDTEVPR